MACDSSLFGSNRALLATSSASRLSKLKASSAQALKGFCSRPSVPRDRRWYNPHRMRKKWFHSEPIRHWVEAEGSASLLDSTGVGIMVVSYNILGDHNALNHRHLYCKVSFDLLKWESRKSLICSEICKWNADVVCLQEVDRFYDILSVMKRKGYVGKYKRRTGGAKDGCAVLWKEKRFRLMEAENIELATFGLHDNVAQLFVFEICEADSRRIVIGNIHVLFNPKRGDVKLGQVRMLVEKAYGLSVKWGNVPIVLMGDFNCTPESGIYKFLSTSKLNIAEHDRSGLSGQEKNPSAPAPFGLLKLPDFGWREKELRNATGSSNCTVLKHPLKLRSSYATVKGTNPRTRDSCGEPLGTTYHSKFLGTVDYIWYSSGLAPTKVLDTVPIDTLLRIGGLPCKDLGSDHLPLVAEFAFTESGRSKAEDLSLPVKKDDEEE